MSNKAIRPGLDDLATTHSDLASEWHPTKNAPLTPSQVKAGSNKQVWWKCRKHRDHVWVAIIVSRALRSRGCPFCSNQRILPGFNDLATTHPLLASEWDHTRNSDLKPTDVFAGGRQAVWWHCSKDSSHHFEMPLFRRTSGSSCSICAGKTVVEGINDLGSANPALAGEWDYQKNIDLDPTDISVASNKKVWWLCRSNQNHSWSASPNDRKKTGCPFCAGRSILSGENDLATISPLLASQWATDLNGGKKPESIGAGSNSKYWWICPADSRHIWKASLQNRVRKGYGCPICANLLVLSGFNDLRTKFPLVAKQWDMEKNQGKRPSEVLFGTETKYWWTCPKDDRHSWQASVSSRTLGASGCPVCLNLKIVSGVNDFATTHPELVKSWHLTRNLPTLPSQIGAGTHKPFWWTCSKHSDHEWKTPLVSRLGGSGCPYCSNQKVLTGFNDLLTVNPDLAGDWHPTKNADVFANSVAPNSNKKFWWVCFNDSSHVWLASVSSRNSGTGCPRCANSGFDTSRRGLFYFIQHQGFYANKVGITNPDRKTNRIEKWKKAGWVIFKTVEWEEGTKILELETQILRWIRKEMALPPFLSPEDMSPLGGWSETFSMDEISEISVMEKIDQEWNQLIGQPPKEIVS
jgi:hypothetical protein